MHPYFIFYNYFLTKFSFVQLKKSLLTFYMLNFHQISSIHHLYIEKSSFYLKVPNFSENKTAAPTNNLNPVEFCINVKTDLSESFYFH